MDEFGENDSWLRSVAPWLIGAFFLFLIAVAVYQYVQRK